MERYINNYPSITKQEHSILMTKTIAIVGVGGLGGYSAEYLSRIGVGTIRLIDFDSFNESNLNRQLFSSEKNIGNSKVEEAKKHINSFNSKQRIEIINSMINESNVYELLKGSDIVVDGLDNIKTRKLVQEACDRLNIFFVHCAINNWQIQVSTIRPNTNVINKIYKKDSDQSNSTLSFIPAIAAGIQTSETIKVLLNMNDNLIGKLLAIDMRTNETNIIEVN